MAEPWPSPHVFWIAAAVLAAIALVTFGPNAGKLGFYLDDWVFLEHMLSGSSWWERVRQLAGTNYAFRPLSLILYPTLYQIGGSNPAPYQYCMIVWEWALAVGFYLYLRRWLGRERLALTAAAFALMVPICPAAHHWITNMSQRVALVLTFVSLLAHLDWMESRRSTALAATIAAFAGSLLFYESGMFLPAMQAAGLFIWLTSRGSPPRQALRRILIDVALPFGAAFAAVGCCRLLYHAISHAELPVRLGLHPAWTWITYREALDCMGPSLMRLAVKCVKFSHEAFSSGLLIAAVFFALCAAYELGRQRRGEAERFSEFRTAAALLVVGFLAAYAPNALSGAYEPQNVGILSRTNAVGALMEAMGLAIGLEIIVLAGGRYGWPKLGQAARVGLIALSVWSFTLTNWFIAQCWMSSWVLEQEIVARAAAWVQHFPSAKIILLQNAPAQYNGAEVFSEHWGFDAALRIATGRKDIRGAVVKPNMPLPAKPGEEVFVYDFADNQLKRSVPETPTKQIRRIPLSSFKSLDRLKPGIKIQATTTEGKEFIGTVLKIGKDIITVEVDSR